MSAGRIRVSGTLSRGRRGMILTTKDNNVWIVESRDPVSQLPGSTVIVDGVIDGVDRLKADWIGPESP